MSNQKIVVLFDVQNLYHSSQNYGGGKKINYKNFLAKIQGSRDLEYARAYAAHKDGKSAKSFYKSLEAVGIEVVSKHVQVKKDNNVVKVIPVHFDVEMSVDALCIPNDVDTVVLCTGNGNFEYLVEQLLLDKVNVEVWSFKESTSDRLIKKAQFNQITTDCLLSKDEEKVQTNEKAN